MKTLNLCVLAVAATLAASPVLAQQTSTGGTTGTTNTRTVTTQDDDTDWGWIGLLGLAGLAGLLGRKRNDTIQVRPGSTTGTGTRP